MQPLNTKIMTVKIKPRWWSDQLDAIELHFLPCPNINKHYINL